MMLHILVRNPLYRHARGLSAKLAVFALMIGFAAVGFDAAMASQPASDTRPPKTAKEGTTQLTIEVFSFDRKAIEPRPVAKALVGIEGSETQLTTDEAGRVSLLVTTKKPTLLVVVEGDLCKLPDLAVTSPQQTMRVLIDVSDRPHLQCQLR